MHPASIIILILSNAGYWLSGTDGSVSASWTVPDHSPQATLVWDLGIDSIRLDGGSVTMNGGELATDFKIHCPNVRIRTSLEFRYQLVSGDGKKLAIASKIIHAFPAGLIEGWANRFNDRNIVVVDSPEGLPALLAKAKVQFNRIDDPQDLQLLHPDIVLIGVDRLRDSSFSQTCLMHLAAAGSGVMIFEQNRVNQLTGMAVSAAAAPSRLEWDLSNPLLAHFSLDDANSWLLDLRSNVHALRLPANSPLAALAVWPPKADGILRAESRNSLFATQIVGSGKIVLCQLHFGSWQTDPRAITLLGNVLDYLSAQSQPTLSTGRPPLPTAITVMRHLTVPTLAGDKS